MSVRGVWVMSPSGSGQASCMFARRYPTVERRAQFSPDYCPLPSDSEVANAVLRMTSDHQFSFSEEHDSCCSGHNPPVYELLGGRLKRVLVVQRAGLVLVGVPSHTESSVPCTLALLEAMAEMLVDSKSASMASKLPELGQFLSVSAPFGTPLDLQPFNVRTQVTGGKVKSASDQQKSASWSAGVYRGPPRVTLCVREEIRAAQYDKPGVRDLWELSGSLLCKTEVEGSPDIQLTLTTPTDGSELDDMVIHPIVHSDDTHHHGNQRKLRFSATLESIPLLHYNVPRPPPLPIRGFYQMRGEESVRLLVQLKLNERVRNSFEFCEVHIPFFNRGVIERLDSVVPTTLLPALTLSSDSRSIVWNIGQKFPVRSLELSLQATVHFKEGSTEDLPFYVGSNSYIEVLFKMTEFTLSGATVDPKSITLFPSTRPRVFISRELHSTQYRIWNSHGDVIATYPQLSH